MKFRQTQGSTDDRRKEIQAAIPKSGDTVRIIGAKEEYIVEGIGMKLIKLCHKDNPTSKKTAFRTDVVKVYA